MSSIAPRPQDNVVPGTVPDHTHTNPGLRGNRAAGVTKPRGSSWKHKAERITHITTEHTGNSQGQLPELVIPDKDGCQPWRLVSPCVPFPPRPYRGCHSAVPRGVLPVRGPSEPRAHRPWQVQWEKHNRYLFQTTVFLNFK